MGYNIIYPRIRGP